MAYEVTWRVKTVIGYKYTNTDFPHFPEADFHYRVSCLFLKEPNDRVVLYRRKAVILQEEGRTFYKRTHQDIYKSDTLDDQGDLIHLRNASPKTWQEAHWKREVARWGRHKRYLIQKEQMAWLKAQVQEEVIHA